MSENIAELKLKLLKEAKKLAPKRYIEYYSIWVNLCGKRLRILTGVKKISEGLFAVSFVFQSPKEEKDLLGYAISVMKKRLYNPDLVFFVKSNRFEKNLFVLAKAFSVLKKEVYWMDDVWIFDCIEKHNFKSRYL